MPEKQVKDATFTTKEPISWVCYCITCKEQLEDCPNGGIATGMGKRHKLHRPDHTVIVGFRVELDE